MYKKNYKSIDSKTAQAGTIDPLFDVIDIMGDHLIRVYEYRNKTRGQTCSFNEPFQDRLIVEAIAGFFMTGTFPFRCPMDELKKFSV